MRLIATFHDPERAKRISALLSQQHIHNQVDTEINGDWGNDAYGTANSNLWIIDEDHWSEALDTVEKYKDGPLPPEVAPPEVKTEIPTPKASTPPTYPAPIQQPLGYTTFYLLLTCIFIFFVSEWTAPPYQAPAPKLPPTPVYSSPTKKALLYDYPYQFELVDQLVEQYGIPALREPSSLPLPGQELFAKVYTTPVWAGLYPIALNTLESKPIDPKTTGPLFEKVQEGEFWRLITPIFLHNDIFHILFNMLWLIVLGRQMEFRLGPGRLLAFIALSAIFSNTAQYLMSGANFIGFSGVLCAMLAFIWQRQKIAPWEGYQIPQSTLKFMFWFIGGMASLQAISFLSEIYLGSGFSPGIANTAHISGLIIGYFMSRWPLFILE
ncbi:MAG: rhomboid family intramembrane serine protease [Parachlamydiales bacterium]|jgi:GlpG protein